MIASLLLFDVLQLSPKTLALREKPFPARLTAPDLASFEVRAAKATCYCRVAEGTVSAPRLRGSGERSRQVAVFCNNERSKPQRFQKACVNSEDEKQLPLDS